ncbi:hypothetical protein [Bradyrhizobium tunisiense]|uniref:hypothetical protein n=1 Tax=Bradyrhizobium tunisiense TaxID=3278709 RepID=UPI0035D66747
MVSKPKLPDLADTCRFIKSLGKPTVAQIVQEAQGAGTVAVQARSGLGGHAEMLSLLTGMESEAEPDILTITIDSYSRLRMFEQASKVLRTNPAALNGYPLVAHGWQRGRELNQRTKRPLDIRHGSPVADELFDVAVASGITSFEGGGISYNLPYSKRVSLNESLAAWRRIDRKCGVLAEQAIVVSREMFGTLTAVLTPPSISLAVTLLEAVSAARDGVRCLLIAYPQGGNILQDVAALRSIPRLARKYIPCEKVYPVLHQYMGPFPRSRTKADALILLGGLVARLGGASKVLTKTYEEARGIPSLKANVDGISLTKCALAQMFEFVAIDEAAVDEEIYWIEREVSELIGSLVDADDLHEAIISSFQMGRLDVPFSPSISTRGDVIPVRDSQGAIRYLSSAGLPFSERTRFRNQRLLHNLWKPAQQLREIQRSINHFVDVSNSYSLSSVTAADSSSSSSS